VKYLIDDVRAGEGVHVFSDFLETEVVSGNRVTNELLGWAGWQEFNPDRTLLVFPGNGSGVVREYLPEPWLNRWRWVTVPAKRIWVPGENPQVVVNRIFPRQFVLGVKDIVLVDDVVSSGQTARAIKKMNEPWLPGARWHVVAWMTQRAATLKGFSSSYFPLEVGTIKTKVPINSLSTLVTNEQIAKNYAQRNYPQPEEFLSALKKLR